MCLWFSVSSCGSVCVSGSVLAAVEVCVSLVPCEVDHLNQSVAVPPQKYL